LKHVTSLCLRVGPISAIRSRARRSTGEARPSAGRLRLSKNLQSAKRRRRPSEIRAGDDPSRAAAALQKRRLSGGSHRIAVDGNGVGGMRRAGRNRRRRGRSGLVGLEGARRRGDGRGLQELQIAWGSWMTHFAITQIFATKLRLRHRTLHQDSPQSGQIICAIPVVATSRNPSRGWSMTSERGTRGEWQKARSPAAPGWRG
jgi:hypothetical protein